MDDEQLNSSKLGTKEYWDNVYCEELENFSCHGDEGEIWFGEFVVKRLTNWLSNKYISTSDKDEHQRNNDRRVSILDIGTGNGMFLVELSKLGFTNLTGVDYSESAIKLAKEISSKHQCSIIFEVANLLENSPDQSNDVLRKSYDICTDKGTFDAISLSPDDAETKKRIYVERVSEVLNYEGLLFLTSCNWTKEELLTRFSKEFKLFDEIPMPQFQYSGKTGQKVTSIVLKKIKKN